MLRRSIYILCMLLVCSCSSNNDFVNKLNNSFTNWNDDVYNDDVKIYALNDTTSDTKHENKGLAWKKEQSQKVVEMYNFDFDKSSVDSEYLDNIKSQAKYINSKSNYILRIAGHADERGSREYNISLGWKRAAAVASYFEQYGVPKQKIMIVSYGKEKPLISGHNPEVWSKNRRVEIFHEDA